MDGGRPNEWFSSKICANYDSLNSVNTTRNISAHFICKKITQISQSIKTVGKRVIRHFCDEMPFCASFS